MADQYRSILMFGAPGVGKGTQGKLLGQRNGYIHLATGDMFRSLDKNSELGRKFLHYSSRGELVPDELTVQLWRSCVRCMIDGGKYDPQKDVLVLDGIPRSLHQAEMLDEHITPLVVVHLTAESADEMVRRMKLRAEKEGRHDDADEKVIRRRFEVYERETAPVLHHYDASLVCDINAIGSIQEVADRVRSCL